MERIKQALERAKQERTALGDAGATVVAGKPGELDAIVYTQTHVVKPDPATLARNRVLMSPDHSAATDSYRMLRTRILQKMRESGWNSVMVTSPRQDEGKSLTAVNLAISVAREVNHTVLLVDLDLRRPSISDFFGYEPPAGIADYLRGATNIPNLLFNPSVERLVIMPGKDRYENSSELISTPAMRTLIAEIKARYMERIVIFDLPPVLAVDDALVFAPHVDCVLMVAEDNKTQQQDLAAAYEVLRDCKILGTVLNKAAADPKNYYQY